MSGLFDTHAHLNDDKYNDDRAQVISNLKNEGVELFVNIGDSIPSSFESVELASLYPFIYATVGVHPHFADEFTSDDLNTLKELAKRDKVVAIGEIGLDYHYDDSKRDNQKRCFRMQMKLAKELNMPVVIHSREATQDTLEILREFPEVTGIVHSFSGSPETAQILTKMGYYLSFNGIATFKNAHRVKEVLLSIDKDRVLIETDSPYLTPEPFRGRRNSPAYVKYVARTIAELWCTDEQEVIDITNKNGKKVYRLEK